MRSKSFALVILSSLCAALVACGPGNGQPDADIHDAQVVQDTIDADAPDTVTPRDDGRLDITDVEPPVDCCGADEGVTTDADDVLVDSNAADDGGWDDDVNVDPDAVVVTGFFSDAAVGDNPHSGLSAVVTFKTSEPSIASVVVVIAGVEPWIVTSGEPAPTVDHTVYVMGLLPETAYRMYPRALHDGESKIGEAWLEYTTEAIPDDFPVFTPTVSQPEKMRPGYTVFSLHKMDLMNPGSNADDFDPRIVTVDDAGRIVGYTKWTDPDARLLGFNKLSNGNFALLGSFGLIVMDGKGEVVVDKSLADLGLDGATATQDAFLHHDIILLPNGNYAAIGTKLVPMSSTPVTTDAMIVDQVIEFTPAGEVVWKQGLDAYVDYTEQSAYYGNNMWDSFYPGWQTYDNMHANSLLYDPSDDSIIAGLHTAGLLVKFSRSGDRELVWILGEDGTIPMNVEGTWFTASHGPSLTDTGHVLVYDNGALLNQGVSKKSRLVEYEIVSDGSGGWSGVNQVWQYQNDFYSHIMGSVQRLSNGNTLMCNGFRIPGLEDPNFVLEPSITEVTGGDTPEVVFNLQMATQTMFFDTTKYLIFRAFRVETLYNWF